MELRGIRAQYEALAPGINRRISRVLERGDFILGEEVTELEVKLAAYIGVKECIGCGNGTDALSLVLEALEIGEGDAVFLPSFTFFATAEVVSAVGAQPVFVDVDPKTFNLSPADLSRAIREHKGGKPKAVIAVDLFGQPADFPAIEQIAAHDGLIVIEDAAQGFGGHILSGGKLRRAGSFGTIAVTSFFPAKPLGCYGDGGAVLTDDHALAERIRMLKNHGQSNRRYTHLTIGRNSRLDTIQAAVLLAKLEAFESELIRVNKAAMSYKRLINDHFITPGIPENFYSSWAQYTLTLPDGRLRDELRSRLSDQGVPTGLYYPIPLHRQPVYDQSIFLPVSENLCQRVLSLPIHAYLSEEDIEKTSATVRQVLGVMA